MKLWPVLVVVCLGGCLSERERELRNDIQKLSKEIGSLEQEVLALSDELLNKPPPTAAIRRNNDPKSFDARKPLPKAGKKPDVLILSIDTLRADHLGAYGYDRPTSPFIDSLAQQGVLFESAWSPSSWTLPSHTSLLSGQLPIHHGVIEDDLSIPASLPLLQESFQSSGYKTIGVVATLFVSSKYGFERGFDHFHDFGVQSKAANNLSTVDADHVFNYALSYAQQQPDDAPIFLFLHVYDVHYGYDAPPPFNTQFDRKPDWGDEKYKTYFAYKKRMIDDSQMTHQIAQYDEEIAFVDAQLKQFVENWRSQRENLIVAVTADHGEEFGERGSWGHAHTLFPEQLHVPLILNGPGIAPKTVSARVGNEDLGTTLAARVGIDFKGQDGVDLSVVMDGEGTLPGTRAAIADTSRFDTNVIRFHEAPWDLYLDIQRGRKHLCRLDKDPMCTKNVYKKNKDIGDQLSKKLFDTLGTPWSAKEALQAQVENGTFFVNGEPKPSPLRVAATEHFLAWPLDASLSVVANGTNYGPYRALGGKTPEAESVIVYEGLRSEESVSTSDEEKDLLRELGYIQDDP